MRRALLLAAARIGTAMALRERYRATDTLDLADAVVLVTGGSRGLGLLLAREFGRQRVRVSICARNADGLERARRYLEDHGVVAFTTVCGVSDRNAVARMVSELVGRFGRIDVLVNNAGIIQAGPLAAMTIEDFEQAMAANFWGMVYATFAVLPDMRRRGRGRIVNVTSIGGKVSMPRLAPYGASKFAAVGFSEGLRTGLEPEGIRVVDGCAGANAYRLVRERVLQGRCRRRSRWFTLASTLPGVSMDAERAAREIVRAARRADTERFLSLPAQALAWVHGLFPATVIDLLTLANRLMLPRATAGSGEAVRGTVLEGRLDRWVRALAVLGRNAGRRFRERPAPDTATARVAPGG